jgi:tRNA threonylcarbamoyladenosine biosynthesis protein TsaB
MTILALDTTGELGSVALRKCGQIAAEAQLNSTDGFAHVIFSAIVDLLKQGNCRLDEVDCFAAANGPGSFTGVRVGLTAVKGLGEAMDKPVAAVSNLRALATFGQRDRRAVLVDARRGEVYAAVYDAELRVVSPEVVTKLAAWLNGLPQTGYEFIAASGHSFCEQVSAAGFADVTWTEAPRSLASAVALCAEVDAAAGTLSNAIAVDANYVRSSDAELFWRDKS